MELEFFIQIVSRYIQNKRSIKIGVKCIYIQVKARVQQLIKPPREVYIRIGQGGSKILKISYNDFEF